MEYDQIGEFLKFRFIARITVASGGIREGIRCRQITVKASTVLQGMENHNNELDTTKKINCISD